MITGYEFATQDDLRRHEDAHRYRVAQGTKGLAGKVRNRKARHSLLLVLLEQQRRRNGGKRWDML